MCSKESIKGRAAFNNLLCIISRPIVPSGMAGRWVRCGRASALASSLPGHLWGGSVPCLQEMQDKGRRARLSASRGRHSLPPLWRAWESREGVCHLSEAQGRRVLFSGMSSFYCCFVFSSGLKPEDWGGEWCSQTAVHPGVPVAEPATWMGCAVLCRCLRARAAHPSQHIWDIVSEISPSGFLLPLLYLYCPRLGQRTCPEMEPKPLCAPHCLHSLPELALHQRRCSVSTTRSSQCMKVGGFCA